MKATFSLLLVSLLCMQHAVLAAPAPGRGNTSSHKSSTSQALVPEFNYKDYDFSPSPPRVDGTTSTSQAIVPSSYYDVGGVQNNNGERTLVPYDSYERPSAKESRSKSSKGSGSGSKEKGVAGLKAWLSGSTSGKDKDQARSKKQSKDKDQKKDSVITLDDYEEYNGGKFGGNDLKYGGERALVPSGKNRNERGGGSSSRPYERQITLADYGAPQESVVGPADFENFADLHIDTSRGGRNRDSNIVPYGGSHGANRRGQQAPTPRPRPAPAPAPTPQDDYDYHLALQEQYGDTTVVPYAGASHGGDSRATTRPQQRQGQTPRQRPFPTPAYTPQDDFAHHLSLQEQLGDYVSPMGRSHDTDTRGRRGAPQYGGGMPSELFRYPMREGAETSPDYRGGSGHSRDVPSYQDIPSSHGGNYPAYQGGSSNQYGEEGSPDYHRGEHSPASYQGMRDSPESNHGRSSSSEEGSPRRGGSGGGGGCEGGHCAPGFGGGYGGGYGGGMVPSGGGHTGSGAEMEPAMGYPGDSVGFPDGRLPPQMDGRPQIFVNVPRSAARGLFGGRSGGGTRYVFGGTVNVPVGTFPGAPVEAYDASLPFVDPSRTDMGVGEQIAAQRHGHHRGSSSNMLPYQGESEVDRANRLGQPSRNFSFKKLFGGGHHHH